MEVCHNNGIHTDNRLENLRFDTHENNMADLRGAGTHPQRLITHCPRNHEYTAENTGWEGKYNNKRYCRQCKNAGWREWEDRKGIDRATKNATQRQRARERRAAGVVPEKARHGTTGTYFNYGCRCRECTEACREYSAKRRRSGKSPAA
jgi:hypothetical protein